MVDNFVQISKMLKFRDDDDFYFLQIIQRKKDINPDNTIVFSGKNNNSRMIKMYQITSVDQLLSLKQEITALCNIFNARAGIDLNRKSLKASSLQTARLIMDQFLNNNYKDAMKAYSSVCGRYSNEPGKRWLIDIDEKKIPNGMIEYINNSCRPMNTTKVLGFVPSRSGLHVISKPFDLKNFYKEFPDVEVHKTNPTNLYIP